MSIHLTTTPIDLVRDLMEDPATAEIVHTILSIALGKDTTPTVAPKTLADAIREYQHQNRLSRANMAAALGISYPYLCELMNGTKTPGKKALNGLTALGIVNYS